MLGGADKSNGDLGSYITGADTGLSEEEWKQAVRFVVSRLEYLRTVTAGTPRVDLSGEPAGIVTASEENHARRKMAAIRARFAKKPPQDEK